MIGKPRKTKHSASKGFVLLEERTPHNAVATLAVVENEMFTTKLFGCAMVFRNQRCKRFSVETFNSQKHQNRGVGIRRRFERAMDRMTMIDHIPIRAAHSLDDLNDDEVIEGYRDGRAGDNEPGDNRSFSYWHGWRNGRVDGGHAQPDDAQRALARDYLAKPLLNRIQTAD